MKFKPEYFIGCGLLDGDFIDEDGYLIKSSSLNGRRIKQFKCTSFLYDHQELRDGSGYLHFQFVNNKNGNSIASIHFEGQRNPSYIMLDSFYKAGPKRNVDRTTFIKRLMDLDQSLGNWLLWNFGIWS
jgi:hypothetical protein